MSPKADPHLSSLRKQPRRSFRVIALFLSCLVLTAGVLPAQVRDEGPEAEARLTRKVRLLLETRNFEALEKLAGTLREKQERFADGNWKLPIFYEAFNPESGASDETGWSRMHDALDAWNAEKPESITARIALSNWWVAYAWRIRGKGWSENVSDEIWKLMKQRLLIAEELLNSAAELPAKCPGRLHILLKVALGEGWEQARYMALADEAIRETPDYYPYYFEVARRLLPRWYGQPGEWERFAVKYGSAPLFTRIVQVNAPYYSKLFEETEVRWEPVREGFEELRKSYPGSDWILNNYARFACLAGDRATAQALFQGLTEQRYISSAWTNRALFEQWKTWAASGTVSR